LQCFFKPPLVGAAASHIQLRQHSGNWRDLACLLGARFDGVNQPADTCAQIVLFGVAAVMSGISSGLQRRLLLWRRRGWEVVGDRVWKHLSTYSVSMCAGCVAGTVALSAYTFSYALWYQRLAPDISDQRKYELEASSWRYAAGQSPFYAVHVLFVNFAMSMLLRRVSDHASHSYYNDARDHDDDGSKRFDWRDCVGQYKLYYLVRSMHFIIVLLCALYIVVSIVISAFMAERAGLIAEAAASFCNSEGTDTRSEPDKKVWKDSLYYKKNSPVTFKLENTMIVAAAFEAAIRVLMAVSFLLFFPACIVMFRRVERRLNNIIKEMSHRSDVGNVFLPYEFSPGGAQSQVEMRDGAPSQVEMQVVEARAFLSRMKSAAAEQRMRFFLCMVLVLVALVAQATIFLLVSLATYVFNSNHNRDCGDCEACQVVEYLIFIWVDNTPEWFPLIVSTFATLPLMFSLLLMTTKEDRALMLNPGRFRADAIAHQPVRSEASARLNAERVRMGIELI
jgi:hypothetical protein